jgi:diguanylate cyclase (GGDEF)-like protein
VCKDQLLGVLQVINKTGGATFTDAELGLVQALADHAAVAIENAALHAEVKRASITDDLTGLGNTRLLHQVLPELLAREDTVSLIVLDLDFLKAVVDRHGHLIGSRTIRQVGRIIASFLGPGDVAARYGGDEFVVILPATGAAAAVERAEQIRRAIADCRTLDDSDVDISGVTASLGVASYPTHGRDLTSLFHAADMALYEVKRCGKNGVALGSEGQPGESPVVSPPTAAPERVGGKEMP